MDIVTYLRGRASLADPLETVFIKIGLISVMEAADEIERLRDAIRFAVEAIDGDDIIAASEHLRAALEEPAPLEDRWDD